MLNMNTAVYHHGSAYGSQKSDEAPSSVKKQVTLLTQNKNKKKRNNLLTPNRVRSSECKKTFTSPASVKKSPAKAKTNSASKERLVKRKNSKEINRALDNKSRSEERA